MRQRTLLRFAATALMVLIAALALTDVHVAWGSDERAAGPGATPTATPLSDTVAGGRPGSACAGDCSGNGRVSIDELVTGVAIALGRRSIADCRALDGNGDGRISVGELVAGVSRLLLGCDGTVPTPTRTPSGAQSVCGGPITSAPKLCNLRISPPRVRRGGNITLSFGLSDLEGDLNTICAGIGPDGAGAPALDCTTADPGSMTVNAEGDVGPIQVNLPIGRYIFALQVRDQAGHASAVLTVEFEVVNVHV